MTVDAQADAQRIAAGFEVDVGRPLGDGALQQVVDDADDGGAARQILQRLDRIGHVDGVRRRLIVGDDDGTGVGGRPLEQQVNVFKRDDGERRRAAKGQTDGGDGLVAAGVGNGQPDLVLTLERKGGRLAQKA